MDIAAAIDRIDTAALTPAVRRALGSETAEVVGWTAKALSGGFESVGVFRVAGHARDRDILVPWSLILKTTRNHVGVMSPTDDPSFGRFWKREALLYRSGLLDQLLSSVDQPLGTYLEQLFARPLQEILDRTAIVTGFLCDQADDAREPMTMTCAMMATVGPLIGILPAIVRASGGTIVDLGLLSAAIGVGSFAGAIYAGSRSDGGNPPRRYALFSLILASAVLAYGFAPVELFALVPLVTLGFVAFAEAVWNTSRIRRLADTAYQARLQAITSMAFTLGMMVGAIWVGAAVDRLGPSALIGGAVLLAAISLAVKAKVKPASSMVEGITVAAAEPEH